MDNITIDKAGRVVIPKPLRDSLRLEAGDSLQVESGGDRIVLRPIHKSAPLAKEKGIWVYHSGTPITDQSIPDLIEQVRNERVGDLSR